MLNALPYGSVGSMLNGLQISFESWFDHGTKIVAYAVCFCGIVGILLAINAIRKQQPSAKYWLTGILALIFGGFLIGGFKNFTGTAQKEGKKAITEAISDSGDTK